jgi:ribosomal protein S6--L-glutamate ligase
VDLVVLSTKASLYSTRRLVDASRHRGHEVRVLDHTRCSGVLGPDGPSIRHGDQLIESVDAIIPRIGSSVTAHGAAIVRQFEVMGVVTVTRSLAIRRARDKLRALQILARKRIPIPRTAFARRPSDADAITGQIGGPPVVIKVVEGTQGVGVVLAETRAAARAVIEAFNHANLSFIVQEYIAESAGHDLRALVIDGEVVAAMERRASGDDFRANLHRGGSALPVLLRPEERAIAVKAARVLGLGVCGVDMLRSERGPLVIEVNASPGLRGIEETTGVDVATRVITYVERQVTRARRRPQTA